MKPSFPTTFYAAAAAAFLLATPAFAARGHFYMVFTPQKP